MKNSLLALLFLLTLQGYAQFSTTHYIPPVTCNNNLAEDQYFYISTPSTTPVNFKITSIGGTTISGTVSNSVPYIHPIGTGNSTQLMTPKTTIGKLTNKGFIIEAENQVYVSMRLNASKNTNGSYNHAGGIVSKGNSALGQTFRLGAMLNPVNTDGTLLNFGAILATENNTTVTISNIPSGTTMTNGSVITGPITVTLNKNESYVLAFENSATTIANSAKMIGALVQSDKPVVVNSGSFGGSNSTSTQGRDIGFDQIVSYEKTGKEYIFIQGNGTNDLERVQLIAHVNNTAVFLNGSTTPFATLNAGEFADITGSSFVNGNLYVRTSEAVFAYQSIGGTSSPANQNLFFVPPINCTTPRIVDNIPQVESIGFTTYSAILNIVTETGSTVSVNNTPLTSAPIAITGNPGFVRYSTFATAANITIKSTSQVYVSYFGTNNAATYGGYYSGFDTKPEIISSKITTANSSCLPNVELNVNTISSYDSFQWFANGVEIPGETASLFKPTTPGYYNVRGSVSNCPSSLPLFSDQIPVSTCPTDQDGDGVNDNIDLDNDNDGITNCTESFGNQAINLSNSNSGIVAINSYSNPFTGATTTSTASSSTPFVGNIDGTFVTETPAGKNNFVKQNLTFNQPVSVALEYVTTANTTDLVNGSAEYIINSDTNKTITVTNPSDQLLIDTNYDGIYESGVTQYSSFEIRFRLNSVIPLAPGTGDFRFSSYLTNTISITHKNLSDTNNNKSTFKLVATCIPNDTDGDGKADQIDDDSDNDGILDRMEAQGNTAVAISNSDTNKDGIDNAFGNGFTPVDTDTDGIPDYLDWDSDNDGINDIDESGSNATNADSDSDGIKNYRELDSDNDSCSDVIEAGFVDPDNNGILGSSPISINTKGQVTTATGYTTPSNNYTIAAPIIITNQPIAPATCDLQSATISVTDNGDSYQWQVSTNGTTWSPITNNATYSGATTRNLVIAAVTSSMNNYKYQVFINKIGNSCGLLSSETTLTVYQLPTVNNTTIVQCDDDIDGITAFNLTVKNNVISANAANETFTYYTSLSGANSGGTTDLIINPQSFTNTTPSTMTVWARVTNSNTCFRVAQITLQVVTTNIPLASFSRTFEACDDFLDSNGNDNANNNKRDGLASFDFSSAETDLRALLPPSGNYSVTFYKNQNDALAEINSITNISTYRNIGYPNSQQIWGRIDSDANNACFGLAPYITLIVEKLPTANPVSILRQCDDNQDGIFTFNTATLENTLINGQSNISASYFDAMNNPLKDANGILITSPFPTTFSTKSQIIKAVLTNNSTAKCSDDTLITFTVDVLPQAFSVPTTLTTVCDDELDPANQNGQYNFDTTTYESTILGSQTGMVVTYTDQNGNALPSPLPNPFNTTTQNVTAKVTNSINSNCSATTVLSFVINPLPQISLNADGSEDELICSNLPTFFVQLNAGIVDGSPTSNYDFKWSKDGLVLPTQTNPTLDVNAKGIYTVAVSSKITGCERTRTIVVTPSDIAKITTIDVIDMADINTVTVNVTGTGNYVYSLDDPNTFFQESNYFANVPSGVHEVYIKDLNGCGTVSQKISVIGLPKFFTPNNDGYNDYWNVKGIDTDFNPNTIIYIFDRYGKLLKQLSPLNQGWDGTYANKPLPSDDYWYTVKLQDGREAKGHFSLKR